GDGLDAHAAALATLDPTYARLVDARRTPSAAAVARLALAGDRVDHLVDGAPAYVRPSEAEVKYPGGVPGALRRP
ncbi:MAG: tRNA (adenosine(37)-N6)-threonylcarbamoyltransferase complex dimerization subunit type 1 TsaB, partial [Myxococcales bacterium]|nr:tRNA (adenosine(37)-N6)-threonylcarbamoyltransferase complex dimerization subunit type 1 TsaB [Myxococcales bacterium]